jgi:hypothetical protein
MDKMTREEAEQRAATIIKEVASTNKDKRASALNTIGQMLVQAGELGVGTSFLQPVKNAIGRNKAVCVALLEEPRTTSAFGISATNSMLGHLVYQVSAKTNPFTRGERKPRADKPTAEEKAMCREMFGNDWWSTDGGKTTDKAHKAANLAKARAALAGAPAPEPMAEAEVDPSSMTNAQLIAALEKAKTSK